MIIMAIDHVRIYFHSGAYYYDPTDPAKTTLAVFFTRWVTHFCAPAFSFLAGISAYLSGKRKTKSELSQFLLKRGIWLVIVELIIVGFGWYFDFKFRTVGFFVIWSLGISMITLAVLIYLPRNYILIFCCLLLFCHNLLDSIHFGNSIAWSVLHESKVFEFSDGRHLFVSYPLIPWIAVMALGYYTGHYYDKSIEEKFRHKLFNRIGYLSVFLFLVLRWSDVYGDPHSFVNYGSISKSIVAFLAVTKYPPSLQFLLLTLGVAFLFLANTERWTGKVVRFITTFGRVPFFYYIIHIYLIHLLAAVFAKLAGFSWQQTIMTTWITVEPKMKEYGFQLWGVFIVWIAVIIMLYPLCKWFDRYKQANKTKWWLSYF